MDALKHDGWWHPVTSRPFPKCDKTDTMWHIWPPCLDASKQWSQQWSRCPPFDKQCPHLRPAEKTKPWTASLYFSVSCVVWISERFDCLQFTVVHTYFKQDDTIWYNIMTHMYHIQTRVYLLVMVSPKAGLLGEGDTLKVHLCSILPLLALVSHYPDGTKMSWISKKSNIPKSHIQLDVTCLQPRRSVYLGISFKDFWLVLVHCG